MDDLGMYDAFKKIEPGMLNKPVSRPKPPTFATIRITETSDELIEAFKQASFACGAADADRIQSAYSHMNVTAETLYQYISILEQAAGHSFQPIIKRF